ncbi:hypothetical protein BC332_30531 [Capsicum chinense]|nr:hypothetical protein BC332_30531 [Capsicum chinense]
MAEDHNHVIVVAVATVVAIEATIAVAQADTKVVRLSGGYGHGQSIEERAVTLIRSYYKGYLHITSIWRKENLTGEGGGEAADEKGNMGGKAMAAACDGERARHLSWVHRRWIRRLAQRNRRLVGSKSSPAGAMLRWFAEITVTGRKEATKTGVRVSPVIAVHRRWLERRATLV